MNKFACCVKIEFDAAHRVIGHSGKCANLHGHRYILEVTAQADELDDLGMVVDFGTLKGEIKKWIDANFDHNVILSEDDREMGGAISNITKQNICYLPYSPTAENISYYLKDKVFPNIFEQKGFVITKVKLQETASCWAIV